MGLNFFACWTFFRDAASTNNCYFETIRLTEDTFNHEVLLNIKKTHEKQNINSTIMTTLLEMRSRHNSEGEGGLLAPLLK